MAAGHKTPSRIPAWYLLAFAAYGPSSLRGSAWMYLAVLTWQSPGYHPYVCTTLKDIAPRGNYSREAVWQALDSLVRANIVWRYSDDGSLPYKVNREVDPEVMPKGRRATVYRLNIEYGTWEWGKKSRELQRLRDRIAAYGDLIPDGVGQEALDGMFRLIRHAAERVALTPEHPTPHLRDRLWVGSLGLLQQVADAHGPGALPAILEAMCGDAWWGEIVAKPNGASYVFEEAAAFYQRLRLQGAIGPVEAR